MQADFHRFRAPDSRPASSPAAPQRGGPPRGVNGGLDLLSAFDLTAISNSPAVSPARQSREKPREPQGRPISEKPMPPVSRETSLAPGEERGPGQGVGAAIVLNLL